MKDEENILRFIDPRTSEDYMKFYADTVVKLIKYHLPFADNLGIVDEVCERYTTVDAISKLYLENNKCYVLEHNSDKIGVLRLSFDDVKKSITIENVYILESFRNKGHFSSVLKYLKDTYKNSYGTIELDCWYGLPACERYKYLGFKEVYKHYRLEI